MLLVMLEKFDKKKQFFTLLLYKISWTFVVRSIDKTQ